MVDENVEGLKDAQRENIFGAGMSKRIWNELYKVIDSSDVVIQVLKQGFCVTSCPGCKGGPKVGGGHGTTFQNNNKRVFSTNEQSRFSSVVLDVVLGPLLVRHTRQCP